MPGDLRDPEQFQQFHYDNRYDNPQTGAPVEDDMDKYLQSIVMEVRQQRLPKKDLGNLKDEMSAKGLFHQHPGDESFRQEVKNLLKARKVAHTWLTCRK